MIVLFRLAVLFLLSLPVYSIETDSTPQLAKYVSVSFEIQGLGESTQALNDAMSSLSIAMKEIAKSPQKLNAEQLREFSVLMEQSDNLVQSIERTLQTLNPTIEGAKKPSSELLMALLHTTREELVEPAVLSVKDAVSFWLYLLILGAIVIVSLIAYGFYVMTKQLREVAKIGKSITDEYEIVRRT